MNKENKGIEKNKEFVVKKYLEKLENSLLEVDISDLNFDDFYEEYDVANNVYTLSKYISIRSKAKKNGEEYNPELDEQIKLLLSDYKVQQDFEFFLINGYKEKSKLRKSALLYSTKKLEENIKSNEEKLLQQRQNFIRETSKIKKENYRLEVKKLERLLKKENEKLASLLSTETNLYNKDLEELVDTADVSANIQYKKLLKYREELKEGFVWTDSRKDILNRVVETISTSGRNPVLIGESGTGKSSLANAAAIELTGHLPVTITCEEDLNPITLISGQREFGTDPETGKEVSYQRYGPITQAMTRYRTSIDSKPEGERALFVRFEEAWRAGVSIYSMYKELFQLKPGKSIESKEVLPGGGFIFTTNPEGNRYKDRQEPDAALLREFVSIEVDFLPMSNQNPELYEFMLACLMDEKGYINLRKGDVSPGSTQYQYPLVTTLPESEIHKHGYLYRMSLAIREIQNAFNDYNSGLKTCNLLSKLEQNSENETKLVVIHKSQYNGWQSPDYRPVQIKEAVITPEDIKMILQSFKGGYFTEEMTKELNKFISRINNKEDRETIKAIFNTYNLLIESTDDERRNFQDITIPEYLTPREIGYLSPRVKRYQENYNFDLNIAEYSIKPNSYLLLKNKDGQYRTVMYESANFDATSSSNLERGILYKFKDIELELEQKEYNEDSEYNENDLNTTLELYESEILDRKEELDLSHRLSEFFNFKELYESYLYSKATFLSRIEGNEEVKEFIDFNSVIKMIDENLNSELKVAISQGINNLVITQENTTEGREFKIRLMPNPKKLEQESVPFLSIGYESDLNKIKESFRSFSSTLLGKDTLDENLTTQALRTYILNNYYQLINFLNYTVIEEDRFLEVYSKHRLLLSSEGIVFSDRQAYNLEDVPILKEENLKSTRLIYLPSIDISSLDKKRMLDKN